MIILQYYLRWQLSPQGWRQKDCCRFMASLWDNVRLFSWCLLKLASKPGSWAESEVVSLC